MNQMGFHEQEAVRHAKLAQRYAFLSAITLSFSMGVLVGAFGLVTKLLLLLGILP